ANGLAAGVIGTVAFFALLGLSLRVLRFDIAAPLLGFSAPAELATMLAAIALATGRPSEWLLDTLSSKRTGAVVTRWLLPAAMVVPIAVGWMRLYAEREGLFGEAFGMALFTLVMIAWFSSLIVWVARTLDQAAAQRAQAEGAATEQREWLHVTLGSIGDGVIATDAAGRVRFLNAAAQRLTGWRAAEAAGRPAAELLHVFDERTGHATQSPLHQALRTRLVAAASGEAALRERNALLNAITTSTPDLIYAKDRTGRMLMANPAWMKAMGKIDSDSLGLDDSDRLVLESGDTMMIEQCLPAQNGGGAAGGE